MTADYFELPRWFIDRGKTPTWYVKGFITDAKYRDYNQQRGFAYERMVASQLKALYPSTEHRYIYGSQPDIFIPELFTEIDTSFRSHDYEVKDVHVADWVSKAWTARVRIKVVPRPVKLTGAQKLRLDKARVTVLSEAELFHFLAEVKELWTEGLPPEVAAHITQYGENPVNPIHTDCPLTSFDRNNTSVLGYTLDGELIYDTKDPPEPEIKQVKGERLLGFTIDGNPVYDVDWPSAINNDDTAAPRSSIARLNRQIADENFDRFCDKAGIPVLVAYH